MGRQKSFYQKAYSRGNTYQAVHTETLDFAFDECVIYFPKTKHTLWFWGIGLIKRVDGARVEIVFNRFGNKRKTRTLFAGNPMARKQVGLLRVKEYCVVYGTCQADKSSYVVDAFFPTFVPTAVDLKEYESRPQEIWEEENITNDNGEKLDFLDIIQGGNK